MFQLSRHGTSNRPLRGGNRATPRLKFRLRMTIRMVSHHGSGGVVGEGWRELTLSCFDEAREPCCWFGLWQTLRAAQSSGKTEEGGLVGILFPFFHVSCDVMCGVCLRPQLSKRCVAGWRWLPARSLLFWLRRRQTGVGGAIQRKDCEDEGLVGILFPFFHMIV